MQSTVGQWLVGALVMCVAGVGWAQPVPPAPDNLVSLARQITEPHHDERAKVEALFDWITTNIEYDVAAYHAGNQAEYKTVAQALLERKGVCDDYAFLFHEMALAVGLNSEVVQGVAWSDTQANGLAEHSWNRVRLGGADYVVDTTWGSGFYNGNDRRFVTQRDRRYLLADPRDIQLTHRAMDSGGKPLPVSGFSFDQFKRVDPNTRRLVRLGIPGAVLVRQVVLNSEAMLPRAFDALMDPVLRLNRATLALPKQGQVLNLEIQHSVGTRLYVRVNGRDIAFNAEGEQLSSISYSVSEPAPVQVVYQLADGQYYHLLDYQ